VSTEVLNFEIRSVGFLEGFRARSLVCVLLMVDSQGIGHPLRFHLSVIVG
jgi:hypothetical protein